MMPCPASDSAAPFQLNVARSLAAAEPVAICQCLRGLTWRQAASAFVYFTRENSAEKDAAGLNLSSMAPVGRRDFVRHYKSLNEKSSAAVSRILERAADSYPLAVDSWSVRRKAMVRSENVVPMDFDGTDAFVPDQRRRVMDFLSSHSLNHIVHSTFSGGGRFRVFVPLDHAVPHAVFMRCVSVLLYMMGPLASGLDRTCFDRARFFYAPNFRGASDLSFRFDGKYLSTGWLTATRMLCGLRNIHIPSAGREGR